MQNTLVECSGSFPESSFFKENVVQECKNLDVLSAPFCRFGILRITLLVMFCNRKFLPKRFHLAAYGLELQSCMGITATDNYILSDSRKLRKDLNLSVCEWCHSGGDTALQLQGVLSDFRLSSTLIYSMC